ncbi:hypothetical protein BVC80_8863g17 [Macleaya cordata]|uniref:Secreted protein n=1 Tax=Macleaya cordata TaxID=56857 RepID=A0A200Q597_MACCD|nr:hypothetical protein BVC80_8863g17 [Macleaya cordata]
MVQLELNALLVLQLLGTHLGPTWAVVPNASILVLLRRRRLLHFALVSNLHSNITSRLVLLKEMQSTLFGISMALLKVFHGAFEQLSWKYVH